MRISDWSSDVCSSDLATRRQVSYRRHAPRRQRRAAVDRKLPGRGSDLGAQRPGAHVMAANAEPQTGTRRDETPLYDRHSGLIMTWSRYPPGCIRSCMVADASLLPTNISLQQPQWVFSTGRL